MKPTTMIVTDNGDYVHCATEPLNGGLVIELFQGSQPQPIIWARDNRTAQRRTCNRHKSITSSSDVTSHSFTTSGQVSAILTYKVMYIYIEREREREKCIYIYIYIYMSVHDYVIRRVNVYVGMLC